MVKEMPEWNSRSKVISILFNDIFLHGSSSAPQQHKSVQYKWLALHIHGDISHTGITTFYQLQWGLGGGGGGGQEAMSS